MANVIESAAAIAERAGLRLELGAVLAEADWLDGCGDTATGLSARRMIEGLLDPDRPPAPLDELQHMARRVYAHGAAKHAQHEGQA